MSHSTFPQTFFRRLSPWAVALLFALMLAGALGVREWPQVLALPLLALALAGWMPLHRPAFMAAWLMATAGLLWLDARGHARAVLGTLPVLVNAGLCVLFARTLRQGHEPLVTRVVRMVEGEDRLEIPGVSAYTRAVTWYWALLTAVQVVLLAACWSWLHWPGATAPPAVRLWLHAGGYALPVLAMLAEYAWRRLRFRDQPHLAPNRFARRLVACWPRIVREPAGDAGMNGNPPGDANRLRIEADHPCLPGHFPGRPLVPGVMLLEQVARRVRARHGMRVTRIVEAKFLAPLEPGREARMSMSGEPPRLRFEIHAGERLLARGRVEAGE